MRSMSAGELREPSERAPGGRRAPGALARGALALAALAALAGAAGLARERGRDRAALARRGAGVGLETGPGSDLGRALAREADPGERRLALARAALTAAAGEPAGGARTLARLEGAAALAREALAALPASAEAPRLLAAARALERLARRDPRLLTEPGAWERPLEAARRRAPGGGPAERLLAAVYLETWPGLDGERRRRAAEALEAAFADPVFQRVAFERWLAVAGSLEAAARLLPDTPESWERLARAAAARGELAQASALGERTLAAHEVALDRALERAREVYGAARADAGLRAAVDDLLARLPPDARFVPQLERALAARPPGPGSPALARAAAAWLAWARPLCLVPGCPLPAAVFDRLAGTAGGALPPAEVAFALVAAGEGARAGQLARRAEALWSEDWAPYLLLEARRRLEADDAAGAREALALVHRSARRGLPFRALARRAGLEPDGAEAAGATRWEATDWEWESGVPRLALLPARSATALRVALARPLARATLVVAEWDGAGRPALALEPGATAIRVVAPIDARAHLLRLRVLAGEAPAIALTNLE